LKIHFFENNAAANFCIKIIFKGYKTGIKDISFEVILKSAFRSENRKSWKLAVNLINQSQKIFFESFSS
jgi:hypothetical protein